MSLSTEISLSDLIEESRSGDQAAFGQLVERFQGMVSSVTLAMIGDLQLSEDIAQETFLKAWTKLEELRDPKKIGSWLCMIARNLCRDTVAAKTRKPLQFVADIEKPHEIQPDEQHQRRLLQNEAMVAALNRIPETYRQPLVLFYREDLPIRDIAATLELSEDAVKQRLSRGRKYLRDEAEKMFEELLRATRPGTAFTIAVLASLPVLHTVAQTATAGSAVSASAVAATGSGAGVAATSKGFSLLALGTVLLSVAYPAFLLICAPYCVRKTLLYAPTLRIRRFGLRNAMFTSAYFWVFAACALSFNWIWNGIPGGLLFLLMVLLIPLGLNYSIYLGLLYDEMDQFRTDQERESEYQGSWFQKNFFRPEITDENWRALKNDDDHFATLSLTPKSLWRWFYGTTILTVCGLLISAERTYRLMVTDEDFLAWKILCCIGAISYVYFFCFVIRGLRSSQDRESFAKTAPSLRKLDEYKKLAFGESIPPMKQQVRNVLVLLVKLPIFMVVFYFLFPVILPLLSLLPQLFWSPFVDRIITPSYVKGKLYPIEKRVLANGIRVWYLHDTQKQTKDFSLIAVLPGGAVFGLDDAVYTAFNKPLGGPLTHNTNEGNGAYLDNLPFCREQPTENWEEAVLEIKEALLSYDYRNSNKGDGFQKRKEAALADLDSLPRYPFGDKIRLWTFAAWDHHVSGHDSVALRNHVWNMTPLGRLDFSEKLLVQGEIVLCGIGKVAPQKFFDEIETQFNSLELHEPIAREPRTIKPGHYSIQWDIPTDALLMLFKVPGPEESLEEYAAMLFATYSMQQFFFYYKVDDREKFDALEADVIKLPEGYFLFFCARSSASSSLEEAEKLICEQYIARIREKGEVDALELFSSPSPWLRFLTPKHLSSVPYFCGTLYPTVVNPGREYERIRTVQQQHTAYRWAYQDYIYRDEKMRQSVLDTCERLTASKVTKAAKKYLTPENVYSLQIIGADESNSKKSQ